MNYLAHAYLSFGLPEITVGNMISDFVKGRKKFDYSEGIQKGISLHRAIDEFTDQHPVTLKAKKIFQPHYRLYSAAFIDVVYDHFLSRDPAEFPGDHLKLFTLQTFENLTPFQPVFPERFAKMFPYMKEQNWLFNYQFRWGLQRSFGGLVHRAAYMEESDTAFMLFEKHYEELQNGYNEFFPDVKSFAFSKLRELQM